MSTRFPLLRSLRGMAVCTAVAAAAALSPIAAGAQTVTAVMQSGLRVLDPIVSTAIVTSIHSLLIYDLLLAQDNAGKVRPQMGLC